LICSNIVLQIFEKILLRSLYKKHLYRLYKYLCPQFTRNFGSITQLDGILFGGNYDGPFRGFFENRIHLAEIVYIVRMMITEQQLADKSVSGPQIIYERSRIAYCCHSYNIRRGCNASFAGVLRKCRTQRLGSRTGKVEALKGQQFEAFFCNSPVERSHI
jgi:hypothetical protein